MTNQAILTAAITKAEKNGYELPIDIYVGSDGYSWQCDDGAGHPLKIKEYDEELPLYRLIIFSKEFAKAFWGDGVLWDEESDGTKWYLLTPDCEKHPRWISKEFNWQKHLQEMVISPDPIRYLEQYLDDKE